MSTPAIIEDAQGIVNGFNTVFMSSRAYIAGSTVPYVNGIAQNFGWSELGGNKIKFVIAPKTGDVVQIYYRPG